MRYFYFFFICFLMSCSSSEKKLTAQEIINKTIQASGSELIANATVSFDFRENHYIAVRNNGEFSLEREIIVDSVSIKDVLTNYAFDRFVNGKPVEVEEAMAKKYANSVNSVHYFSVLPFGLNDAAVQKKLLPETTIKEKDYYRVEISFSKENGGEDFEDIFIYWINKQTFFVDYLAYEFYSNGRGVRFRELKEQCVKNGVRFVDYNNYKPNNNDIKLIDLEKAYENNELVKLSEIILKNIAVFAIAP